MNRFFLAIMGMMLLSTPAFAEVCDKEIGGTAPVWLMNASLWTYIGWTLTSPISIALLVAAILTIAIHRLKWLALALTILTGLLAIFFLQESFSHDPVVMAAYTEGCGNVYPASFTVYAFLALAFLGAFIKAVTRRKRARLE